MHAPQGADAKDAAPTTAVDWPALRLAAREAAARGYAPYSGLQVGAAGLVDDGRLVLGCNVENASFGLTLCAECGMLSALHVTGGGRLLAVACRSGHDRVLLPCGRCRQLLYEAGGGRLEVDTPNGPRALRDLLPDAFGPADLP
ncbi:MAG: cytidine deaminase [Acidimicrobiales bacterium]